MLDDFKLTQLLGKGTFGEVYLTSKKNSNSLFATKRMDRDLAEHPQFCKYFVNEVSILRNIHHKNIVKVEGLKKTKNHYYIVMELCNGGSLKKNLEKYKDKYKKPFPENVVQHIMRQVVSAINYLHGLKIVHRDLKLDNILVNYNSEEDKKKINLLNADIKIVDFGFATHISNVSLLTSCLGSPFNMDPRILKKFKSREKCPQTYDEKADIWSLGTLCYQMLVGEYAFVANNVQELSSKIEEGTFKVPINLAKETISFLIDMLQYDSSKRKSASELSKHPFLMKHVNDFSYIDLKNVSHKVSSGDLYINIKDNKTISSIVNKEGVKQCSISPSDLFPLATEKKHMETNIVTNANIINNAIQGHAVNNNKNTNNNNPMMANSVPIPNISQYSKDPVINELLNLKVPQSQKSLMSSLILSNEKSSQISKLLQNNDSAKFDLNNPLGFSQTYQSQQISNTSAQIYPTDSYKINYIKQQMQAINNTPEKNEGIINQTKTFPNRKNKTNFQLNYNNPNSAGIGNKILLSPNLENNQNIQRFNTINPQIYNEYNSSAFYVQRFNLSDKQLLNINNQANNRQINYQHISSKNIDPRTLNIMNTQI